MLARLRSRRALQIGPLLLTLGLALAVAPGSSSAQPVSPPIQLPSAACATSQVSANYVSGEGAAGTLEATLQLVNTSATPCTLDGYVTVLLLDASSMPLPTNDVPGGGVAGNFAGPSTFVLVPGAASGFAIFWHDVPSGGETSCPTAAAVQVTPPNTMSSELVAGIDGGIAPCEAGTVDVEALQPPGTPIP